MKNIRHFAEYTGTYILFLIFKILPVDMASALGGWLGRLIGPHLPASDIARRNLLLSLPNESDTKRSEIIKGVWNNLGRVVAEYPHLETIAQQRVAIGPDERLENILKKGGPALFIGGHFANWEVPALALYKQRGVRSYLTYRAPNNPFVARFLERQRTLRGTLPAIPKSRRSAQQILSALREGNFMGILIDQKYNEGPAVPFFERPARTNPIFVTLGQKFSAPVIPMRVERLKGAHFKITLLEELPLHDKNGQKRPAEDVIKDAHSYLEDCIKARPEQWLWLHKRWPPQDYDTKGQENHEQPRPRKK